MLINNFAYSVIVFIVLMLLGMFDGSSLDSGLTWPRSAIVLSLEGSQDYGSLLQVRQMECHASVRKVDALMDIVKVRGVSSA